MTNILPFIRPSAASTWINCSGYPLMRSYYPDEPEEADQDVREDGTACHWLAAEIFNKRVPALNSLSPNGRVLDEDMFDAADLYLDTLRAWGATPEVERSIPVNEVIPGQTGTPDAFAYAPAVKTLHVADLKYGFKFVEVWENWQLLTYVCCLLALLKLDDRDTWVEMTIVQPRSNHRDGPVRTWRVQACDLRAYFNILKGAAADCMKATPPCTPGPYCGDCPARHSCTALQHAALRAIEQSYASIPHEISPAGVDDELRRMMDAADKLDARITGLKAQAENIIRTGTVMQHFDLAPSFARERWRDGTESHVLHLGALIGKELAKPQQPVSPAAARRAGVSEALVSSFAHKPSTGVKLVKTDPFAARKRFSK